MMAMTRLAKLIGLLIVMAAVTSGCAMKKPVMDQEQGRPQALEERGKQMVSQSPSEVQKVVLTADSFRLADPFPRVDKHVDLQTAGPVRLEDILIGLSRELRINLVYDVRTTRPEDVKEINRQIGEINTQFAKNSGNNARPDTLVVPPETTIQTRKVEDSSKQVATSEYTPGTKKYAPEDQELFDRVAITFSGNATDLFRKLADVSGCFFIEQDNSISVRKVETFSVSIPSYPGLLPIIENNLGAIGARDIAFDNLSNSISFKADYRAYKRIGEYLKKIRDNAAVVGIHVTIINVKLNDNSNWGIDWNQVKVGRGWSGYIQGMTGLVRDTALGAGVLGTSGSGGISLLFDSSDFSMQGFVGFLDTFGHTERGQNAIFNSLSGTVGKLENMDEIRYVKNLGAVALNTNATTTRATTEMDVVKVGSKIEVSPYYNQHEKSLTVKLNSELTELVKFETYDAGKDGTLRYPQTASRKFETTLRLKYNQVAVIGGLITTRDKNDTTTVPGIESFITTNKAKEKEQTEMVIVVKPYITEFVYGSDVSERNIN